MTIYRAEGAYCPVCNGDLSSALPERGGQRSPKADDLTVCSHCTGYLRYVPDGSGGIRLDVLGRDDFERLPEFYQAGLMQSRGEFLALKEQGKSVQPTKFEAVLAKEIFRLKNQAAIAAVALCGCCHCKAGDSFNCNYRRRA